MCVLFKLLDDLGGKMFSKFVHLYIFCTNLYKICTSLRRRVMSWLSTASSFVLHLFLALLV